MYKSGDGCMRERKNDPKKVVKKGVSRLSFFRILFIIILFVVLIICAKMHVDQKASRVRLEALARTLQEQEEIAFQENQRILTENNRVHTDEYIEEYARDRMGLIKEGEIIFETRK